MNNTVNSFTETTKQLLREVNLALDSIVKLNESLTTQEDTVVLNSEVVDPITGDVSIRQFSIPSYNTVINRVNTVKQSMDTFVRGEGVVLLNDGTYRKVSTVPVSKSPIPITNLTTPTRFWVRDNWFFETLMHPQMVVHFDMKGRIDDRSDRIQAKRVIFDNFNDIETQWFRDNFIGQELTYAEAIERLNTNNKRYWLDEETHYAPIRPNPFQGSFLITGIETINSQQWYFLNMLNYSNATEFIPVNNIQLAKGDLIRFENSIFKIEEIEVTESRIRIIPMVGIQNPKVNASFFIYSTPFEEKMIQIPVAYDECNILFLRGTNDDFNVAGDSWGTSTCFYSNDLVLNGTATTLPEYYYANVADWGKKMAAEAKENFIPALYGIKPDPPTVDPTQVGVVQINTQLDAALDTEAIKQTKSQIESTKTIINSQKNTIAQQKAELVEITDEGLRASLQEKIDTNISQLSKKTVEYQSLVRSLATVAYENDAVMAEPKYRVRGFFEIPKGKLNTEVDTERPQEIVKFEIEHRYLRLDGTGNPLNTFSFVDPPTGQTVTGTYSDWVHYDTPVRSRVYDESLDRYVWADENIADGDAVNINQLDIPIQKGELVQVRIRSISEAGWPNNPVKSEWCNPFIVEFPANLETSDQTRNILQDATIEETTIKLQETLAAVGVETHLQDSIPNPMAGDGTYFKHQARFLAVDLATKNEGGIIERVNTGDLQTLLSNLSPLTYVTLSNPDPSIYFAEPLQLTVTLQRLFQAIVNSNPAVYEALSTS